MNYTFFIGNGFDLGMGLKTSYSDFIQYYLTTPALTPTLKKSRSDLVTYMQTIPSPLWMDLEVALGILTGYYPPTDVGYQDFLEFHDDITLHLHKYISAQSNTFHIRAGNTRICRCFHEAITQPFMNINNIPRQAILNYLQSVQQNSPLNQDHYSFVSFNFSDVFDRCLIHACRPAGGGGQNCFCLQPVLGAAPAVIHIHGNAVAANNNGHLLLGINDITQAVNNFHRPNDLAAGFVKPQVNHLLQNGYATQVAKLIEESNYIIICGTSLGETDKVWWQMIGAWLNFSANHRLIIHTYQNQAMNAPHAHIVQQVNTLNRFLAYQEQSIIANINTRIHIVVSNRVF